MIFLVLKVPVFINMVRYHGFSFNKGSKYLLMRYCTGTALCCSSKGVSVLLIRYYTMLPILVKVPTS